MGTATGTDYLRIAPQSVGRCKFARSSESDMYSYRIPDIFDINPTGGGQADKFMAFRREGRGFQSFNFPTRQYSGSCGHLPKNDVHFFVNKRYKQMKKERTIDMNSKQCWK